MSTYKIIVNDSYDDHVMTLHYVFNYGDEYNEEDYDWDYETDISDAALEYFWEMDINWEDTFETITGEDPSKHEEDVQKISELKKSKAIIDFLTNKGYDIDYEAMIERASEDNDFYDYAQGYYEEEAHEDFNENYEEDDTNEYLSRVSHYW